MKSHLFRLALAAILTATTSCASLPLKDHVDYDAQWIMMIESLSNPMERVTIRNTDGTTKKVLTK